MDGQEVVGRLNARALLTSTTISCPKYVYTFRTAAAFSPRRLHHKWCCKGDCATTGSQAAVISQLRIPSLTPSQLIRSIALDPDFQE